MVVQSSEIERYKIQIEGLNQRMSDMEMEGLEIKEKNDNDILLNEKKRIE